jgi:hypothetical protein
MGYSRMVEFWLIQKKPSVVFSQSKLNDPAKGVIKTSKLAFS